MNSDRQPSWRHRLSKYIALMLLGASFGAATMLILLGHQIDNLYGELERRGNELTKVTNEVEQLREQLSHEQREEIVQAIDLQLLEQKEQHLNKVTREKINAEVYQWLKQMNIIGEPVSRYAGLPHFFRETINHHPVKLDQKTYELQFEAVAISSRVRIWFYVQEVADGAPPLKRNDDKQ